MKKEIGGCVASIVGFRAAYVFDYLGISKNQAEETANEYRASGACCDG